MRKVWFLAAVLGVGIACQEYHFKAVQPRPVVLINKSIDTGVQAAPPVLVVIQDTSGSMCEPITTADQLDDGGYCAAVAAQTKMAVTAAAMSQVFGQLDPVAHPFNLGLYSFPNQSSSDQCATGGVQVPITNAASTDGGSAITSLQTWYALNTNRVGGGTPTAATINALAGDQSFTQSAATARRVLLLVTDGLPNCDGNNPCANQPWSDGNTHGCESPEYLSHYFGIDAGPPAGCSCSTPGCDPSTPASTDATCCAVKDPNACLDAQASVQAIKNLYDNHQVTTFVVGMGYDLKLTSGATLDAMAQAGQGGNPDAGHFQADSPQQLQDTLQAIITLVTETCTYNLDSPPADPRLLEVILNGTTLMQGDPNGFNYIPPSGGGPAQIQLLGTSCSQLQNGQTHTLTIHAIG